MSELEEICPEVTRRTLQRDLGKGLRVIMIFFPLFDF